ncbi:helix-turn-helix domain-containing protein, partial [Streptomyces sp. NPDC059604]|uniref:helix-turn-helix domain-containing protein n=1 Tax=Streptomyces sp. NPDC059604 TaxID=3346881 RepID=UPI0036C89A93
MPSNVNPTVRRRRLGQELRRLRELKGMTAEEVAERLLVSQSKISRLENGRRSISQRDVGRPRAGVAVAGPAPPAPRARISQRERPPGRGGPPG